VRRDKYGALVEKHEGRSHLGDSGLDGRIILERIFGRLDGGQRMY
jgi:hypothetical protein